MRSLCVACMLLALGPVVSGQADETALKNRPVFIYAELGGSPEETTLATLEGEVRAAGYNTTRFPACFATTAICRDGTSLRNTSCAAAKECAASTFERITSSLGTEGGLLVIGLDPSALERAVGGHDTLWDPDPGYASTTETLNRLMALGLRVLFLNFPIQSILDNGGHLVTPRYREASEDMAVKSCRFLDARSTVVIITRNVTLDPFGAYKRTKGFEDGIKAECDGGVVSKMKVITTNSEAATYAVALSLLRGMRKIELIFTENEKDMKQVFAAAEKAGKMGRELRPSFVNGAGSLYGGWSYQMHQQGFLTMYTADLLNSATSGLVPEVVTALPLYLEPEEGVGHTVTLRDDFRVLETETFLRSDAPRSDLKASLTEGASVKEMPATMSGAINITLDFDIQFLQLDLPESLFVTRVNLLARWVDSRLTWSSHHDIKTLVIEKESLWHPNITAEFYREQRVIKEKIELAQDGTVSYIIQVDLEVACDFDFRDFPGDKQACGVDFISDTVDANLVAGNLRFAARVKGYFDPTYLLQTRAVSEAEREVLMLTSDFKVALDFEIRRQANAFLKFVVPGIVLEVLTTMLFFIQALGPRVQVATICVLTQVNLRSSVYNQLPDTANADWLELWFNFNLFYSALLFSCFAINWDSILWNKIFMYHVRSKLHRERSRRSRVRSREISKPPGSLQDANTIQTENITIELASAMSAGASGADSPERSPVAATSAHPENTLKHNLGNLANRLSFAQRGKVEGEEEMLAKLLPNEETIDVYSFLVFALLYAVGAGWILASHDWSPPGEVVGKMVLDGTIDSDFSGTRLISQ
eukprot:CAMPEP_0118927828 /NCGR_PEP_ID=MMETSP1169-20130426/5217_1 /TAXON_ID=36882 /ORGANISM="Pyramimonas obovata, Strain CCMP722" /LENGTH=819 /DNA_ID=CAMNT_0006869675 /DNA_START=393 /DNA_END=2852 /DNA_ORIENTATION=-